LEGESSPGFPALFNRCPLKSEEAKSRFIRLKKTVLNSTVPGVEGYGGRGGST